ncbi:class I SAM-dependent methyltransferase [Aliiroseovarius sp.]|uniref:class I SAM-dependent methyltransferase n=1 Tax=Aliiroseovarius sp. TaxID=1872442 RepID=UPI0026211C90|nr:class I SAM-dependent methyltransferase [Aliiroseovarius sp.]
MMKLLRKLFGRKFDNSGAYWLDRYEAGGTSGAGSYGRLAEYKARIINALVAEREIGSVVEIGCGDGNQCSLFDFANYTGVDISPKVVAEARTRFADRPGWEFHEADTFQTLGRPAEMSMSLDVIYHLVEDEVFDTYMRDLTDAAGKYLLVYASDHDAPARSPHVRHRAYSDWLAANAPEFELLQTWEHEFPMTSGGDKKETSFAFFRLFGRIEAEDKSNAGAPTGQPS